MSEELKKEESERIEETKEIKKDSNEMPEKTRKIVGVVIMVTGTVIAIIWSSFAGVMILFTGMWAYNPEVKEGGNTKIVPTWLGTLLIIAVSALLAWLYKTFIA